MKIYQDLAEFATAAGRDLGRTGWLVVDQAMIDQFAGATGDHQRIHANAERAADGPFGGTIAHGLLTLSLRPAFRPELSAVRGVRMAVNCGFNKVRFVPPVPARSKLKGRTAVREVAEVPGGIEATLAVTVELDGSAKPACAAESVVRYLA